MGDLIDIRDALIVRRLQRDAEELELLEEQKEEIWQRIIARHPELEHAVFDLPDEYSRRRGVLRRFWRWLVGG